MPVPHALMLVPADMREHIRRAAELDGSGFGDYSGYGYVYGFDGQDGSGDGEDGLAYLSKLDS